MLRSRFLDRRPVAEDSGTGSPWRAQFSHSAASRAAPFASMAID
jgi:hypothetical protein